MQQIEISPLLGGSGLGFEAGRLAVEEALEVLGLDWHERAVHRWWARLDSTIVSDERRQLLESFDDSDLVVGPADLALRFIDGGLAEITFAGPSDARRDRGLMPRLDPVVDGIGLLSSHASEVVSKLTERHGQPVHDRGGEPAWVVQFPSAGVVLWAEEREAAAREGWFQSVTFMSPSLASRVMPEHRS